MNDKEKLEIWKRKLVEIEDKVRKQKEKYEKEIESLKKKLKKKNARS